MDYVTIFDPIPWGAVGASVLQTFTLYWLVLLGVRLSGRRIFGEMGPQDIIIIVLVGEACGMGLYHQDAGYWGTVFSVLTILAIGALVERIPPLRGALECKALTLYDNGKLNHALMRRYFVELEDLRKTAREYGLDSYTQFKSIILEGDGSISGIIKLKSSRQSAPSGTIPVGKNRKKLRH